MAIIIKHIEVQTVVERRIVNETEISDSVYLKIIDAVVLELKQRQLNISTRSSDNDRER